MATTLNSQGSGEYLLLATPVGPPPAFISRLKTNYPLLKIEHIKLPDWHSPSNSNMIPAETWKKVTIFLTASLLPPSPEAVPNLKFIQLKSAGSNRLHGSWIWKNTEIPISCANGIHGPQIAEWVMMTALAMSHQLPTYLSAMKEEKWIGTTEDGGVEDMVGKRIGILGYGSIGRQIGRVASALGMTILAYTHHPRPTPSSRHDKSYLIPNTGDPKGLLPHSWHHGHLASFLSLSLDILVICLPATPATQHLISTREFHILSEKKTFVSNIGRGSIIDTDALIEALEKGWIRGAALDVTDPEPLPKGHRLWGVRNLIVTPHVSGCSNAYMERVFGLLEENVGRMAEGKGFINLVRREEGY